MSGSAEKAGTYNITQPHPTSGAQFLRISA